MLNTDQAHVYYFMLKTDSGIPSYCWCEYSRIHFRRWKVTKVVNYAFPGAAWKTGKVPPPGLFYCGHCFSLYPVSVLHYSKFTYHLVWIIEPMLSVHAQVFSSLPPTGSISDANPIKWLPTATERSSYNLEDNCKLSHIFWRLGRGSWFNKWHHHEA